MAISISHVSDTKKEQFICTAVASVVQCQCSQVGSVCVCVWWGGGGGGVGGGGGGGGGGEERGHSPPKNNCNLTTFICLKIEFSTFTNIKIL